MSEYFPKPKSIKANLKAGLDLSNYATSNLSNLNSKIDKLDIGKFETSPVDLSKLSRKLKKMLLKRLNMMNCLKKLIILILLIL